MTQEKINRLEQIKNGETPNGYKCTDVGILPNDWGYARLSDISEQITQTAGTEKYETVSISAGIGFVNQAKKFGKELSGKQYAKYTVLHKGDFSYNKGNSKKYPQGCVYRLKDRETAAVPNVFESFRITTGCAEYYDQLFVSGYLNHQLYRLINHGVRDDGLLNLTHKDFYSCLLPVPPLSEQEKIAKILSAQDKVIECYEKKIEQLRLMKKYYLQNMFPKRGETVPKIRFKGFTESWEQRKLGDISNSFSGGTPSAGKSEYYGGTIPFIRSAEVNSSSTELFLTEEGLKNSAAKMVHKGDVLYALYGATSGETGIAQLDGAINQAILSIKPHESYDAQFIMQWLRKSKENIIGTYLQGGQGNLSGTIVTSLMIDCPRYVEQQKIGDFFKRIDSLITLHQRLCDEEKKKKKALQQLLLTGIVRTNEL